MKELIERWMQHPEYDSGVALYRKYGKDPALMALFSLRETSYTFGRLREALAELIQEEKPSEETKPKTPPQVLELIQRRSQLHESLFHTPGKEDRYTIAKTILAIGRKLDRYYDDGELPDDQAENEKKADSLPTNAWELHMLINNNTAYLAKNRKREDKQGEVKRRERQSLAIEQRLKEMNHGPIS